MARMMIYAFEGHSDLLVLTMSLVRYGISGIEYLTPPYDTLRTRSCSK